MPLNASMLNVGDLLLTLVGDPLRRLVRKSDIVARIGGDEFTVLLDNIQGTSDVEKIVTKIINGLQQPAPISSTTLEVSVSVGVALWPDNGTIGIELMQKADMALYESKALGPGQYNFFTENLQERLVQGLEIERGLKTALAESQFELYYQPQVNLENRTIIGAEALIRWPHPEKGMISPAEFVPVATRCGLIVPIGLWVLETACKQIRAWYDAGFHLPVAVNVSPRQLKYPGFFNDLMDCVTRHKVPGHMLEIELTEEAFIDTGLAHTSTFNTLRQAGIHIAIDDFGTGYSSMRYLKEIPLDRIKIDRSFISEDCEGLGIKEREITKAIILLATSLNLEVVAEGIETEQQANDLKAYGCPMGQGFLYYKPMRPEALQKLFTRQLNPALLIANAGQD